MVQGFPVSIQLGQPEVHAIHSGAPASYAYHKILLHPEEQEEEEEGEEEEEEKREKENEKEVGMGVGK